MNRKPEKPDELKFYTSLLVLIYQDAAAQCGIRPSSIKKDCKTLRERCRLEGMGFLTKTLPTLGKCLDKALSSGGIMPTDHAFTLSKRAPYSPVLFGEIWARIFDCDGLVRLKPSPHALWSSCEDRDVELQAAAVRTIRQVCYLLYKLEGAHSKEDEARVISRFIEVDQSLPEEEEEIQLSLKTSLALENARLLIFRTLKGFDPWDIVPSHGPGAVATGEKPWQKMNFARYYEQLDKEYPYSDYFFFNYTHLVDNLESLEALRNAESTAKVVLVPKDSRGPRLISMEPLELQWIQQGLMRGMVREIESPRSIASGYVNFTDQQKNRDLAGANSEDGEFVTVDMKEASDRVSLWLVRQLFPRQLYNCLKACRSQSTVLPGGHRLSLKKFAPMGSSVCFPVEALTFWALAVGSLTSYGQGQHSVDQNPVWVYGDDLVATRGGYDSFRPVFEELHLEFNEDKCCTGRFFRESCGVDSFRLKDVTPIRIKARWAKKLSPSATLSYISYVNSFRDRGYELTANILAARLSKVTGPLPLSNVCRKHLMPLAIFVNWESSRLRVFLNNTFQRRHNKRLSRIEYKIPMPCTRVITRGEPGWEELLRLCSRKGSSWDPFGLRERAAIPCRHTMPHHIKLRWKWVAASQLLI